MKSFYTKFVAFLISLRFIVVAEAVVSGVVSARDRRLTRARWDGEDWQFTWADGCLYWESPRVSPKLVTTRNFGPYIANYAPTSGDTVIEVGAGVGTEVCRFSSMVGPSGQVVAVEADPIAVRRLAKQARCLASGNVTVMPVAVGREDGRALLYLAEPGHVQNSTVAGVGTTAVEVPQTTLHTIVDRLDSPTVSYMKINIEGAEYDALLGLGDAISRVSNLFVSCHDFTGNSEQRTYERVRDYLIQQGMTVVAYSPDSRAPWIEYYLFAHWGSAAPDA